MSESDKILSDEVRELDDGAADRRDNTAVILNERRIVSEPLDETQAKRQMAKYSRRGFLVGGAAAVLGVLGWRWMPEETKASLLRRTFEFNERVSQALYKPTRLEKEFPASAISPRRVNGDLGLKSELDPVWTLTVAGLGQELVLSLDDIKELPRTEMITELKCIEGWSVIVQWAGVRFADFAAKYGPRDLTRYVSMTTPDNEYFVGWDIESIMHPQTLLAYEMNGAPLLPEHGAPLRLASPTKYGIKLIKRIGRIEFTNERPRDYWAENGYDLYSGH
jgi:DMSO/TMAO reductase YedYZ molybdopterin-dependent catalytic subunit